MDNIKFRSKRMTSRLFAGVIVPWEQDAGASEYSYRLVCRNGCEYGIADDGDWDSVLKYLVWSEVKVSGVLDEQNHVIFPQKIMPQTPDGGKQDTLEGAAPEPVDNVIDIRWRLPIPAFLERKPPVLALA